MAVSRRNRYGRSTTGQNAIGFFSPVLAYTSATTYAGFVQSATTASNNGQMVIINATTAGVSNWTVQTTLLGVNAKFFIAQVQDGDIRKSPILTMSPVAGQQTAGTDQGLYIKKTAYAAPVFQATTLGYNGTSGDLGLVAGSIASPASYSLSARDLSPSTQPFPVQSGSIVSTSSSATKTDLTFALASDFVNAQDYEKAGDINFVSAEVRTNGTNTAIATVTASFIQFSSTVVYSSTSTLAVGDIIEFTPGSGPSNGIAVSYKIIATPSTTVAVLDRPYQGLSFTTGAGGTGKKTAVTSTGLFISTFVEDTNFALSYSTLPVTLVTVNTAWRQGSGAAWQAAQMELDTQVMSGSTNINAPFLADLGQPTLFVTNPETSTVQYTMYFIRYRNITDSMAKWGEQIMPYGYIIMGIPNSGGPQTTIDTVLGS